MHLKTLEALNINCMIRPIVVITDKVRNQDFIFGAKTYSKKQFTIQIKNLRLKIKTKLIQKNINNMDLILIKDK